MNKLDEYISNESQRQFSDLKREEIVAYSKRKNYSVATCQNCGEAFAERDSRKELKLCPKCESGRAAISYYQKNHKLHTLSPSDFVKIANSKITRRNTPK